MNTKKRTAPGTLLYTGSVDVPTKLTHIQYNKTTFKQFDSVQPFDPNSVDWVVVEGLSDLKTLITLQSAYQIDALIMEDILHVNQRTKIEVFDNSVFAVFKYTFIQGGKPFTDYISVLLTEHALFTFSEHKNLFLEDSLARIQKEGSHIRNMKQDYLFYVLFDMVVDESMEALQSFMEYIQTLELEMNLDKVEDQLKLYSTQKHLLSIRNFTQNLLFDRETKFYMEHPFFKPESHKFYKDVDDHLHHMNSIVLTLLDSIKYITEMVQNNLSNRTNKIMMTLTIFSAIFIPLSFLAGVFGMNFVQFAFLQNPNGLLYFLLGSLLLSGSMLFYFYKNNWFSK